MIKHILVPTDGSAQANIGVQYAVAAAKRLGAVVHGLYIVDSKLLEGPYLRDISASLGQEPYVNHQGKLELILEERGKVALGQVESACKKAGVECKTELHTGMVVSSIVEASELCDTIIMGRSGEHAEWLDSVLGSTTESVARRSKQPLIVTGTPEAAFGRVLAAYDGSDHAKSALRLAADLVEEWKATLVVLTAGSDDCEAIQQEAREYIEPHKIDAEFVKDSRDAGNAVIAVAKEVGADIVFIGAYGHNIIRERILGSTTTFILNNATTPILLVR